MKKLFLAAAVALIAGGITSCKKSGEETKNEPQQSETSVSDNGSKTTVTDTNADATAGDTSGVDLLIATLDNYTQQLGQVKSQEEFIKIISVAPEVSESQKAYVLTDSDKSKLKDAYNNFYKILVPLGVKYNLLPESEAANMEKEQSNSIDVATTLGDLL